MYKYLIPILLFLLCNFAFGQEETQITFSNNLPDSIQILLDKKDITQEERIYALCKTMDYYALIHEFNKIEPYIIELETITNNSNDTYYRALFNYYKGRNLFQNNSISAIKSFYESIRQLHLLPKDNKIKELEIQNYIALSSFYINNKMFLDAYEVIKNGLNINNELKNQSLDFKLNSNLASLYSQIGFRKESFNINHQLLESIKDKGAEEDIHRCNILNNIGIIHINLPDSAIIYYDSALSYAKIPHIYIILMNNIGEIYLIKHDLKKAETYFNKSLKIAKQYNITKSYNCILNNIARTKLYQKEYDSAIIYTNKAIDFAKDNNFLAYEKDALFIKKQILNKLNKYKEYVEVSNLYDLISDSLIKINNWDIVKKNILQEQILAKEKEFNDEIVKQKYQNKKEKLSLIIIISMLLIIVVILIYIYKLSADKKRVILNNKKLKEEALSNELDLRNRELTSNMLMQVKNNDILLQIIHKLSNIPKKNKVIDNNIQSIITYIKHSINTSSYDNFEYYFVKVHPNFFNKLLSDFPDLTQQELRICSFIKLNIPVKDIASIINLTPGSIRNTKWRIKKKFHLEDSNESLTYFLSKY